jgi:hypothetical protein
MIWLIELHTQVNFFWDGGGQSSIREFYCPGDAARNTLKLNALSDNETGLKRGNIPTHHFIDSGQATQYALQPSLTGLALI